MSDGSLPHGKRTVRLGFTGDLVLGRHVTGAVRDGLPPEAMWGDLRSRMVEADAVIGNLEGPITTHAVKWNKWKAFYFRADPKVMNHLHVGNYRCLALANNHMVDFGSQGLFDTRRHLTEGGFAFAGAGADPDEAMAPTTFTAGDRTIGFISITNTVPAFAAKPDRPGTNYWKIETSAANIDRLTRQIADLRGLGTDLIVLSVHWGPNYRWWPPANYKAFARKAIDLGIDIVHGHSAHLLQAVEFHGKGVILYDTGDYIDDFIVMHGLRSDYTGLFLVDIAPGQSPRVTIVPAKITFAQVHQARGRHAHAISNYMLRRCRSFNVDMREENGELVAVAPGRLASAATVD